MDWRRNKERALFGLKDWRLEFDLIVFLSKRLIFWGRDFEGLAFVSGCCRLCLLPVWEEYRRLEIRVMIKRCRFYSGIVLGRGNLLSPKYIAKWVTFKSETWI